MNCCINALMIGSPSEKKLFFVRGNAENQIRLNEVCIEKTDRYIGSSFAL